MERTVSSTWFVSLWVAVVMVLFSHQAQAQRRAVRDSALTAPHVHLHGGMGSAAGDLGLRYGSGGNFGVGMHVKMKSGFYTGVQVDFGFGMGLKEPGVLSNLLTPAGQLIDNEGQVALLTLSGKSALFTADVGYLFDLPGTNANSGLLVTLGVGSVHHRIHFENTENLITQLQEPYLSGYDRFTWGVGVRQFAGYWHMSDNGLVNWFAGIQLWEARTWPQRPMNFDTQLSDASPRFDAYAGIQAGWILHIYKRSAIEHWN